MNERIYYTDSACREFEAVVTRVLEHDGRPAVTLDRTAFYPTSGGQPFDTGFLGNAAVVDVVDVDDEIVHVLSTSISAGTMVRGSIDAARRLDHMQQHTGQHVLSAAFERRFENRTMSFHMGADSSTIDLAREASSGEVEPAVDEANRVVWENRPVSIRFVSEEEARALPLRKEPVRGGTLRLVEVADFDLSACGGTHVDRTGTIGVIAVTGVERFRGGSRVTFVCGGRALRTLRLYRDAIAGSVRMLSVLPQELPAAIERTLAESRELQKSAGKLQESLAVHEAARLVAGASDTGGVRHVVEIVDGWDARGLKAMASAIAAQSRAVAVLISAATPALVVVARSADATVDANKVLRSLLDRFGGRGGGKSDLAQGGGLTAAPAEIAAAARDLLRS